MSELQQYYDDFRRGQWAQEDPKDCPCGGSGWALSDVDTFHKCPKHHTDQPHPEDHEELEDAS